MLEVIEVGVDSNDVPGEDTQTGLETRDPKLVRVDAAELDTNEAVDLDGGNTIGHNYKRSLVKTTLILFVLAENLVDKGSNIDNCNSDNAVLLQGSSETLERYL